MRERARASCDESLSQRRLPPPLAVRNSPVAQPQLSRRWLRLDWSTLAVQPVVAGGGRGIVCYVISSHFPVAEFSFFPSLAGKKKFLHKLEEERLCLRDYPFALCSARVSRSESTLAAGELICQIGEETGREGKRASEHS